MSVDCEAGRYAGRSVEPPKGGWPGWLVGVSVVVAAAVAGAVAVALAWSWLTGPSPSDVKVDGEQASLLDERLAPVLGDFEAVDLGDLGASHGAAVVEECWVDSGQVHQPDAVRAWSVLSGETGDLDFETSSRQAASSVVEQLRRQGWEGGQESGPTDWTGLSLPGDGYTVIATVVANNGVVSVSADAALDVCG